MFPFIIQVYFDVYIFLLVSQYIFWWFWDVYYHMYVIIFIGFASDELLLAV